MIKKTTTGSRKERDTEDKRKICSLLLPVIQATRAGEGIVNLEYFINESTAMEFVKITYDYGYAQCVNVTLDSGAAMVLDVIKRLL